MPDPVASLVKGNWSSDHRNRLARASAGIVRSQTLNDRPHGDSRDLAEAF